jgi:REP element-mobilizing transposase RayT
MIKCVKGRLQTIVRKQLPKAFKRNYHLESVGESNNECLQRYVAKQAQHHPMADDRVQEMIAALQFCDPSVDLEEIRYSSHGQFVVNLHLVFENVDHLPDIRKSSLQMTREMILAVARKKNYLLARIGLVSNHVHILLGCGMDDGPLSVALGFMNNLAYAHGMKRILEPSFYVGTFGRYDRDAIRRNL